MNSLGRKVLVASLGALILLTGCYALVARELAAWNDASTYVMRDFRRALLDGEIHAALTRAVGETASYLLTGSTDYQGEATEAVERANAAASLLRQIADETPRHDADTEHVRLQERQERLLRFAQESLRQASSAVPAAGAVGAADALKSIYAHEAEADNLWQEVTEHHRVEQLANEQILREHGRRVHGLVLAGLATFTLTIVLVIVYVRWRIVSPLTALARLTGSVAVGDLSRRAKVTHRDEIGQLQRSFNQMVADLEGQRRQLSTLVESLAHSRDTAEAANQAKSEFLANVSHEIRTPMNGVIVSLDLMHETAPDAQQRDLTEVARTSARSLLGMLNDLLDFSRIEVGRLELHSVSFEPRRLVSLMVEQHGLRAQAKGLAMTCHVAADIPTKLRGDPIRLGQVLLNLLDNAIKFTERGSIEVSVSIDPAMPPPGLLPSGAAEPSVLLRLSVTDSGVGIPPEAGEKIFQPFYQVEGATSRYAGGIGLGLGIARQLARLMGGELSFESKLGEGTSCWFTVRLPLDAPHDATAMLEVQPRRELPAGKAVLLAEDHSTTREVVARALRRRGLRVSTAEDGRAALALATAQEFDLLLMDCRMPNMDGFQATHAIRALGGGHASVPIIALTAYGITEPKQRYLDAGFDDLVVKPYTLKDIEELLYRWLVLQRRDGVLPVGAQDDNAGSGLPR